MDGNLDQAAYDAFAASGEIETAGNVPEAEIKEIEKTQEPQIDSQEEQTDETSDEGEADDTPVEQKPKKTPQQYQIERMKRENAELKRQLQDTNVNNRLNTIENRLPMQNNDDIEQEGSPEPNPMDLDLYPLGHLDSRYVEDKTEWLAEKKVAEQFNAVLHRQQQQQLQTIEQQQIADLQSKVTSMTDRGNEVYDDFQEAVIEAGLSNRWPLTKETFEAAHEADHGTQILYELAKDVKEATRVAQLSLYQQVKYVADRNNQIALEKGKRNIPKAGEPPKTVSRGANSRTHINPATDNLDDFEKLWETSAKRKG
jgi:hypothetical protein